MQTSITRNRDWARHASEYCRAVAPYATPLLEMGKELFAQISSTRERLHAEEYVEAIIKKK